MKPRPGVVKKIHHRYLMANVSLTKEGPWVRGGGGEGRVQGEESVIVALPCPSRTKDRSKATYLGTWSARAVEGNAKLEGLVLVFDGHI